MATTGKKRGRKPSTPSKSVKGKTITQRCSTAGTVLRKSKRPTAKSRAGRTLGGKC
jgi:hypothetical protein